MGTDVLNMALTLTWNILKDGVLKSFCNYDFSHLPFQAGMKVGGAAVSLKIQLDGIRSKALIEKKKLEKLGEMRETHS